MVEQFAEFKELKNIDKTTMISVLEESFRNVLAKMFETDENLDVILNPDKGDVQIFQNHIFDCCSFYHCCPMEHLHHIFYHLLQ